MKKVHLVVIGLQIQIGITYIRTEGSIRDGFFRIYYLDVYTGPKRTPIPEIKGQLFKVAECVNTVVLRSKDTEQVARYKELMARAEEK